MTCYVFAVLFLLSLSCFFFSFPALVAGEVSMEEKPLPSLLSPLFPWWRQNHWEVCQNSMLFPWWRQNHWEVCQSSMLFPWWHQNSMLCFQLPAVFSEIFTFHCCYYYYYYYCHIFIVDDVFGWFQMILLEAFFSFFFLFCSVHHLIRCHPRLGRLHLSRVSYAVCVSVCVCVWESERVRERLCVCAILTVFRADTPNWSNMFCVCVCVCVCVCGGDTVGLKVCSAEIDDFRYCLVFLLNVV